MSNTTFISFAKFVDPMIFPRKSSRRLKSVLQLIREISQRGVLRRRLLILNLGSKLSLFVKCWDFKLRRTFDLKMLVIRFEPLEVHLILIYSPFYRLLCLINYWKWYKITTHIRGNLIFLKSWNSLRLHVTTSLIHISVLNHTFSAFSLSHYTL